MSQTFTVENFKGVREITLSPSGSLVVIAGGNGAGKSSFIDAFVELFDPKGTRLTPKPIREGEDEARAEFTDTDLGVRIVRTWKKNDAGRLEVFALDGAKYSKPAEVVAQLTGGLIFDPVAFLNLDERKQRDALLAKVELPFDVEALAREKAGAEERRLVAGRDVKRLQGALSAMPNPLDAPDEEVSGAAVLAEIETVQEHNHRIDRAEDLVTELGRQVLDTDRTIERLEAQITQARADRAVWVERIEEAERAAAAPRADLEPLRAKLAAVDETNAAVRARREYAKVADEYAAAETAQAAANRELEAIEKRKREGLAAATFPVDGLSVDENGVTFDGVPFTQVNSAMRRRVAFAIATAGDPKLRLVIVKDGDLLDADSLAAIREIADERGYTVLVERDRDESRQIGFTIEDGALA
ncbi:ATP-binding protein [Microbacterium sp. MMO-56]|uniref:ATP-binding protein n=3 Tax=Microbacterium TaxID=33882 RepID=UPI003018B8E9